MLSITAENSVFLLRKENTFEEEVPFRLGIHTCSYVLGAFEHVPEWHCYSHRALARTQRVECLFNSAQPRSSTPHFPFLPLLLPHCLGANPYSAKTTATMSYDHTTHTRSHQNQFAKYKLA